MSFTRLIYNLLLPHKIEFSLSDIPKAMRFLSDLTEGKYLSTIEKHEIEKFLMLAKYIDERKELLPHVVALMNSKKGDEIKESLLQHRVLIHCMFYNKPHVMGQLSKIIDELEVQVCIQEQAKQQGYIKIVAPAVQVKP